ncbi:inversin-B-like isoform X2 [Dysidea avara]|uniref:inversin-B-like isoform X2 n=1 Tax=Dysidea avara TaxID=196820 RepID=UPI0033197CFA
MADVYELLIHCASQGDVAQLDSVLTKYANDIDINFQTEGGLNLLIHTVISAGSNINPKGRYLDVVKVLVRVGISLAVADVSYGRTALHWAVQYDLDDILTELLIADSEDICKIPDFSGMSPFHLAIQVNSIKCLELLLAHLPPDIVEYPDTQGQTPLTLSITTGTLEPFVLLLNAGADVTSSDNPPLLYAAQCGQTEMLELLLRSNNVNVEQCNSEGQTVAHVAASQNSPDMLQAVTRNCAQLLQSSDSRGITPLMYACGYGIDASVKFLIKKKVSLDAVDSDGKGCIHWACESHADKAHKCIQILCKALPSLLELCDKQGRTPLHSAAMGGNSKNIETLINLGCNIQTRDAEDCTALHWAAGSGQLDCLVALAQLGLAVNVPTKQGNLPVHYAANSGNEACLKYLLEAGCDMESEDGNKRTPLHWAAQNAGSINCLQLLVMFGADCNKIDGEGLNALHMASRNDNLLACQYLIETARCNGNAEDAEGQTSLFHALEGGSLGCMEFLLSRGSNCNHQNRDGRSLTHLAASLGFLEALQLLAQYGADFELQSSKGVRPIHDAAANGQADTLEYLASIGCDIYAQTSDGSTILHYSAVQGQSLCVKMILDANFDPNVVLTTEENDKLTPLDCAQAYGHAEAAALIQGAGGQPYSYFSPVSETKDIPPEEDIPGAVEKTNESAIMVAFDDEKKSLPEKQAAFDAENKITEQSLDDDAVQSGQVKASVDAAKEDQVTEHIQHPLDSEKVSTEEETATTLPKDQDTHQSAAMQSPGGETIGKQKSLERPERFKSDSSLFSRAISFLRGQEQKPTTMIASAVALYGAQATFLAGAIMGSPLGRKAMEVGEKVAKNAADDLIDEASQLRKTLPVLLWEESRTPTPLPTPTPPATPSPEPVKAPSPVVIDIDPLERRIRKARAQLDTKKTPAFLAIQELLKAEATHVKLTKQFEFARLEEHLEKMRMEHKMKESKAKEESKELVDKYNSRLRKIQATSETVHSKIDEVLETAATENAVFGTTLQSLGISPKPSVSEWLKKKQEQKRAQLQTNLISWDIHKPRRDQTIKMKQTATLERATRHAAWETEKNIQHKIKLLKNTDKVIRNPYLSYSSARHSSSPTTDHLQRRRVRRLTTPHKMERRTPTPHSIKRSYSVQFTPKGFTQVALDDTTSRTSTPHKLDQLWKLGDTVAKGNVSSTRVLLDEVPLSVRVRATGPKTYHMSRSLVFVPPEEYNGSKKKHPLLRSKSFEQNSSLQNEHTVQYHTHTGNIYIT